MKSETSANNETHVVILVHGIRTFGEWQERFNRLLKERTPSIEVVRYRYGFFPVVSFLIPFLRIADIVRFRRYLEHQASAWKDARVDIVAHSFGTYIVAKALKRAAKSLEIRIHTVILCGSVVDDSFQWERLTSPDGLVGRVVNYCGLRDSWVLAAAVISPFMGLGGLHGFTGPTGTRMHNRFFAFGHSGFFQGSKHFEGPDDFMRQNWIPLIATDQLPPEAGLDGPKTS